MEPTRLIQLFNQQPEQKTFQAGEVIFEEGETGKVMYGVREGQVEMFVNGKLVETIEKGDLFGEGALVHPDHKRRSTAVAKTDCTLFVLNQERFLFLVQETPLFALDVMRSYSDRFIRLKNRLLQ